jgi:serine/threonine protein kinase
VSELLGRVTAALADRYLIERELESAGTTVAFLGRDESRNRPVTVKVFRPDLAAALDAKLLFQEIRAARLTHPGIATPSAGGQAGGLLYYVTPGAKGETLKETLERQTRLSIEEVKEMGRQVAEALSYAHGMGVVHRDIRPESILLSEDQAVVTDFGIAQAVRAAGGERLGQTVRSGGIPYYRSPEQLLGDEVDERSDVYALGAVLFEAVTGEKPFQGDTAQKIAAQHIADPVRKPREVQSAVPSWMSNLIVRCLEKSPGDRFQTAADLAQALDAGSAAVEPDEAGEAGDVLGGGSDEDLGVGEIVQGAGWDFSDVVPEVKPAPQPVYDVGPGEGSVPASKPPPSSDAGSAPESGPATAPDSAAESAPESAPPPLEPIGPTADFTHGNLFDIGQATQAREPEPEPEPADTEATADEAAAAPDPAEPSGIGHRHSAAQEALAEIEAAHAAGDAGHGGHMAPRPMEMEQVSKLDQVRRKLEPLYGYGPELIVRVARQRMTWYVVGGGVGLILFWIVVKALFFGPANLHWQFISNQLVEPVQVLVDGRVVQTLQPGQQDSMVLPRDRPIEVGWRLIRPQQAGGQPMGSSFEAVLSAGRRRGEDVHSVIAGVTADRAMFAPAITNRTTRDLVALINPGTPMEVECNCVIPARGRGLRIGYYPLLENSSVRFFDARQGYRGVYQDRGVVPARVDSLTGATSIELDQWQ